MWEKGAAALLMSLVPSVPVHAEERIVVALSGNLVSLPITPGLTIFLTPGKFISFVIPENQGRWRALAAEAGDAPPEIASAQYGNTNAGCFLPEALAELCDMTGIAPVQVRTISIFSRDPNDEVATYLPSEPSAPDTNNWQSWAPPGVNAPRKASCNQIGERTLCSQSVFGADWVGYRVWLSYEGAMLPVELRRSIFQKIDDDLVRFLKLS